MSRTLQFPYSSSALERVASPTTLSAEVAYSTSRASTDDLSRNVYGLLGLSVDAIDFATVLQSLEAATGRASPFLISTKDPQHRPQILRTVFDGEEASRKPGGAFELYRRVT